MPSKEFQGAAGCLAILALLPGLLVITFAMSLFGGVLQAFVLDHFWAWFLEPLGVQAITFGQALGICFVVTLLLNRPRAQMDKPWQAWATHLMAYPIYLLFGYIVHLFIS